ncbi:universal stress protein [Pinibacter aurantiacus]|uniref:Universal stress protein n=1 Tax=Pinibacter aurantiacus TaxID=2851599 RepID=A0A9E2W6U0_9BACT|nr:universal stress protein [Pinibacter aurantiacus]MBV4355666.1 universal stress protein [Pinibacter aurantiacus]
MNTFIVPVDFTEIGDNAAVYAGKVAQKVNGRIILVNVYEPIPAGIDGTPLVNDPEARHEVRIIALEKLKGRLLAMDPQLDITCVAEPGISLLDHIETQIEQTNATMVIMGVSEDSGAEQFLLGTNAINIVNIGNVPVLIVPPGATYSGINEVVLAVDFEDEEHVLPLDRIRSMLELFKPTVNVVSIADEASDAKAADIEEKKMLLQNALSDFTIDFSFVKQRHFVEAINEFANNKKADLILVLPHKHSFIASLFRTHATEKLIHHTSVPVLALHD